MLVYLNPTFKQLFLPKQKTRKKRKKQFKSSRQLLKKLSLKCPLRQLVKKKLRKQLNSKSLRVLSKSSLKNPVKVTKAIAQSLKLKSRPLNKPLPRENQKPKRLLTTRKVSRKCSLKQQLLPKEKTRKKRKKQLKSSRQLLRKPSLKNPMKVAKAIAQSLKLKSRPLKKLLPRENQKLKRLLTTRKVPQKYSLKQLLLPSEKSRKKRKRQLKSSKQLLRKPSLKCPLRQVVKKKLRRQLHWLSQQSLLLKRPLPKKTLNPLRSKQLRVKSIRVLRKPSLKNPTKVTKAIAQSLNLKSRPLKKLLPGENQKPKRLLTTRKVLQKCSLKQLPTLKATPARQMYPLTVSNRKKRCLQTTHGRSKKRKFLKV